MSFIFPIGKYWCFPWFMSPILHICTTYAALWWYVSHPLILFVVQTTWHKFSSVQFSTVQFNWVPCPSIASLALPCLAFPSVLFPSLPFCTVMYAMLCSALLCSALLCYALVCSTDKVPHKKHRGILAVWFIIKWIQLYSDSFLPVTITVWTYSLANNKTNYIICENIITPFHGCN